MSVAAAERASARPIAGRRPRGLAALTLLAIAALLPFAFSPGGDVLNNLVLAATYVVMALGLNVIVGFAGLLDLGYVAFFAIGAYTAAYLASGYWGIHLNILLVLVAAAAAATVAGTLIGVPTLRLRGDYIAIVTLAFGEIIGQVVVNGREIGLFGGTLTRGAIGIGPIDKIDLPLIEPFGALDLRPWYWFALALVAAVLVINVHLRDSRIGRAWIALRDDEEAAAAVGIPVARTKLLAYGTGAALGAVAGAFLASYLSIVDAGQFEFSFSIFIFSMVVLGGLGSIRGVVVAAVLLSVLNNYLLPDVFYDLPARFGLGFDLSAISSGIYGLIIVVVMLLFPDGFGAYADRRPARHRPARHRAVRKAARMVVRSACRASSSPMRPARTSSPALCSSAWKTLTSHSTGTSVRNSPSSRPRSTSARTWPCADSCVSRSVSVLSCAAAACAIEVWRPSVRQLSASARSSASVAVGAPAAAASNAAVARCTARTTTACRIASREAKWA